MLCTVKRQERGTKCEGTPNKTKCICMIDSENTNGRLFPTKSNNEKNEKGKDHGSKTY